MRVRRRTWLKPALLVAGADAALLLGAGLVLGASRQLHASAFGFVSLVVSEMSSFVPAGVLAGLAAIGSVLGAGWWQQNLIGPAISSESGAGLPALGGVLAAPVYLAVRRTARAPAEERPCGPGAPPHRIYVGRLAKLLEPRAGVSTAVQEPL